MAAVEPNHAQNILNRFSKKTISGHPNDHESNQKRLRINHPEPYEKDGRGGRIRTYDLLLPRQAR